MKKQLIIAVMSVFCVSAYAQEEITTRDQETKEVTTAEPCVEPCVEVEPSTPEVNQ